MKSCTHTIICPACGGDDNCEVESVGQYRVLCCQDCRLSFADPMLAGDSQFYVQHIVYQRKDAATVWTHYHSAKKASNRRLLSMVPTQGRVLDIGCGYGAFVKVALESGFDAYGVDFNAEHICAGRSVLGLGHRLVEGSVDELKQSVNQDIPFDLITMFEVIEHVEEPAELIHEAYNLLKEGGILAVSCPNEARWQPTGRIFVDYPPHHLTRWRPDTMRTFLEQSGFEHMRTEIDSSFRDLLWVAYVNRSARKKLAQAYTPLQVGEEHPDPNFTSPTTRKTFKMKLDALVRMTCTPLDIVWRVLGIGTMGMRVIARKL